MAGHSQGVPAYLLARVNLPPGDRLLHGKPGPFLLGRGVMERHRMGRDTLIRSHEREAVSPVAKTVASFAPSFWQLGGLQKDFGDFSPYRRLFCNPLKDQIYSSNQRGVGATGFEPATSWSQTKRSTKLSYAPNLFDTGYRNPTSPITGRLASTLGNTSKPAALECSQRRHLISACRAPTDAGKFPAVYLDFPDFSKSEKIQLRLWRDHIGRYRLLIEVEAIQHVV